MCGLAGFVSLQSENAEVLTHIVKGMGQMLSHRGPDDDGIWCDETAGVALAHCRLAILDLSPAGRQPMVSASGRYVIVFNGEIYNFREIRKQLVSGHHQTLSWRGHSDTEVMLAAIDAWGMNRAIRQFVGMFAFALWDRQERTLTLARDRLGEKPLYYGWQGSTFLFGSELKALRMHPAWRGEIDRNALARFMRFSYVPTPWSIHLGIRKLLPGTTLTLAEAAAPGYVPEPEAYWSARDMFEEREYRQLLTSDKEAEEALNDLLRKTISDKMVADVPLGAFLSGGVDSSTIVALMQAESNRPVKTFSIGFHESGYNEASHAAVVARHLGTEHTELYVTPAEAMDVIPRLPEIYDEPFADVSQIPTFLVSQMTRQQVTVALSGDGGDELFGGYNRYVAGSGIWRGIGWMPRVLRKCSAAFLTSVSPQAWDAVFSRCTPILPPLARQRLPGDKLHKLAGVLEASSPESMYQWLVSHWSDPAAVVLHTDDVETGQVCTGTWTNPREFAWNMMYYDLVGYLPDDILCKVDRAAMSASLETRVPFLDHRVVEFAWRLPLSIKIRQGKGKWILRQVLYRYVPSRLIERPKMGFGVPIDTWLRGPLRSWAEDMLSEQRLRENGYLNPDPIRRKWVEHLSGKRNWQYHLWDVLMFQQWLDRWEN